MNNTIEGLEAWMSDVSVSVDVTTEAPAEGPVEPTPAIEQAVEATPQEDAFEETTQTAEEDTQAQLILTQMTVDVDRFMVLADKMDEMERMINFLKEEGLNRSFVKLYTPKLLNNAFDIVIPSLEAIDNTTTGTTAASQGAASKISGALSTAGNALKNIGNRIIETLQKFGKWCSEKLTAFKEAMTNLGKFVKGKVIRGDVNPNAKAENLSGGIEQVEKATDSLVSEMNGGTGATAAGMAAMEVVTTGESTIGQQARDLNNTATRMNTVLTKLNAVQKWASSKINALKSQLSSNEADKATVQAEIKKTQEIMKKATGITNTFQNIGKSIRDFISKYMAPSGAAA